MGSKKYPKENLWDEFVSKNRGDSNAWTDCERVSTLVKYISLNLFTLQC